MSIETYERESEAQEATITFFKQRNIARGQSSEQVTVKRELRDLLADGTKIFIYTYEGEMVEHIDTGYQILVNFPDEEETTQLRAE